MVVASSSAFSDQPNRLIEVVATGTVEAPPDVAHISAGVLTQAPNASQALSENTAVMKKVIEAIKAHGVEAKDIKTSTISISARHATNRSKDAGKVIAFEARNQVELAVRNIASLGEILDKLVETGANQLGNIRFSISNAAELLDEARKKAMTTAFQRAGLYANAAKVTLGEVLTVRETAQSAPAPYGRARTMAAEAVPIEAGTESLTVALNVTFALKPQ